MSLLISKQCWRGLLSFFITAILKIAIQLQSLLISLYFVIAGVAKGSPNPTLCFSRLLWVYEGVPSSVEIDQSLSLSYISKTNKDDVPLLKYFIWTGKRIDSLPETIAGVAMLVRKLIQLLLHYNPSRDRCALRVSHCFFNWH